MKADPLRGLDILVVEDHYFVATELTRVLRELGADVIGPVSRLPLDGLIASRDLDLALLDVQIVGGTCFPLVDEMTSRGIPVALVTGYGADSLPPRYRALLRLDKPVERNNLTAAVLQLAGRSQGVLA